MNLPNPLFAIACHTDPKVPDTLLPEPTHFPTGDSSEFGKLEPNKEGKLRPKYAACKIDRAMGEIFIDPEKPKQFSISGHLTEELPKAEWEAPKGSKWSRELRDWLFVWGLIKSSGSEIQMLLCRRPELGPKTKELIASLTSKGWEELHLVWEAEQNWTGEWSEARKTTYTRPALLVVGEYNGGFRVVAKIGDRTL
jgi:hypothetical protein